MDKTIRLNDGVKITRFPDSQTHVTVQYVTQGDVVRLVWPIRSNDELVQLMQISNALDGLFVTKAELVIPYLMGARSDRRMEFGGSVDLRVVADCINSCGFGRVHLFDVHSDVALQLIDRSHSHDNSRLVKAYGIPDSVLICPDAGAAKKVGDYAKWNPKLVEIVECTKVRDLSNGRITLRVLEPERCKGRPCVIVDDICDGGATFLAIAQQISPSFLTLIVSHGIFSKGLDELDKWFDSIITSDSFFAGEPEGDLSVVALNL